MAMQEKIKISNLPDAGGINASNIREVWERLDQLLSQELRKMDSVSCWSLLGAWTGAEAEGSEELLSGLLGGSLSKPVLFICCDLWMIGGIERVMTKLMEHFSGEYQIVLLSLETGDPGYPVEEEVFQMKLSPKAEMPDAVRTALLAKLLHADIFLGNANQSADFLPVYEMLGRLEIRTVMMNHCFYLYPYRWECFLSKAMQIRKSAVQYADAVLFLTTVSAELCALNGRTAGVMPNPNTFAGSEYHPGNPAGRRKNIVAVGRFNDPIKRIDKMIRTFAAVYRQEKEAKLILVGKYDPELICDDAEKKTVGALTEELQIPPEAIEYAGETVHVEQYYQEARVLLFASECEGFGLVLNEAAVFGVPAAAYYYPGIEDILTDGENGFVTFGDDIKRTAEKILLLLQDDVLFEQMSKKAAVMAERFSENLVFEKWDSIFRILLKSCGTKEEIERELIAAGIIIDTELSEQALKSCISEYGRCMQGMTDRICRCDNMLELLHAQYVNEQEENKRLRARIEELEKETGRKRAGIFRRKS